MHSGDARSPGHVGAVDAPRGWATQLRTLTPLTALSAWVLWSLALAQDLVSRFGELSCLRRAAGMTLVFGTTLVLGRITFRVAAPCFAWVMPGSRGLTFTGR